MGQRTQTVAQTQQANTNQGSVLQRAAITPIHSPTLQRCSNGVECPECRQKHLQREGTLQRTAVSSAPTNTVPPIAHGVLNSPGQPLDAGMRAFMEPRFGYDFSQVRLSSVRGDLAFKSELPRLRQEIPLQLGFDLHRGGNSSQLDDTVSNLSPGRPLSPFLRNRLPDAPQSVIDKVQVHDDPQSRATADLLNSEGLAYRNHIVLGSMARNSDWLTAHELGHVLQQSSPTLARGTTEPAVLEHEADRFADIVMSQTPSNPVRASPLSPASPGLAQKVIWKHIQNLPNDLLLILDVDDGDFVGGCVRAVVPHVGVKLIKKYPHMQLANLHVGFLTNPAGEYCIFFYESVTGICEMLCFPSKQKLRDSWGKVKEWLKEMIKKLLKALAIAVLVAAVVILAYLIVEAILAALAALAGLAAA